MTGDGGRRILIIGVYYAPEHSAIAPYTTGLAEHLVTLGDAVTVLTAMPHYPMWKVAPEYRGRLHAAEVRNGVRVLRRALYVPSRQSAVRRAAYEATFIATALPVTGIERPDAIVGIVPGLNGGVLARLLAARYRTRYGILFQDLMGPAAAQSGIAGGGAVARATGAAERWTTSHARAVAAVSPAFLPYLRGLGIPDHRLSVVPNWTHVAEPDRSVEARTATRTRLGWAPDETVVLHAGNMGNKQHLDQVLAAAATAPADGHLRFVLLGDGNRRADLEAAVRVAGLTNVEFLPPEPDATYPAVLAAADVLLVTERATVVDMALPSKLTSYAVAGRPVIAAVNADGATAAEVERAGNGLVIPAEDPVAVLAAIDRLRTDRELVVRLAAAGPAHARAALSSGDALARAAAFVDAIAGATALTRQRVALEVPA